MSRLDKLKEQHPDLNVSLIDIITSLDPTGTYKYTEFLIKNFKRDNQYYSPNLDELKGYLGVFLFGSNEIEVLNEFERHSRANRIKEKDISKYKNFKELNEQVKIAKDIEKQKEVEKQILKIHEDDTWLVLTPLSFDASRVYGSNTKWCTTQERYWDKYLKTHRLVYCINKKTDTKIAFSRDYGDDKFQAWTADDSEVSPMFVNFIPDEIFLKIRKELQKNERTIDLIYGKKRNKPVSVSDIINTYQGNNETTDHSNIVDRIRSLMDLNRYKSTWISEPYMAPVGPNDDLPTEEQTEQIVNGETVVRRRITDYPRNMTMDINDYLTYFNHTTPSLVSEHDVRPITSFTGGTINY